MEYDHTLSIEEKRRRKDLSDSAKNTVRQSFPIAEEDDTSLMMMFDGFYLQISFSEVHPLIVIYLVCGIDRDITLLDETEINRLNLKSVLGVHLIDTDIGCYAYRAVHWMDVPLTRERLFEILYRCLGDAQHGCRAIVRNAAL